MSRLLTVGTIITKYPLYRLVGWLIGQDGHTLWREDMAAAMQGKK